MDTKPVLQGEQDKSILTASEVGVAVPLVPPSQGGAVGKPMAMQSVVAPHVQAATPFVVQQQPMPMYVQVPPNIPEDQARFSRRIYIFSTCACVFSLCGLIQWSCSIPALVLANMFYNNVRRGDYSTPRSYWIISLTLSIIATVVSAICCLCVVIQLLIWFISFISLASGGGF